jgi:hypothetical protein
MTIADFAAFYVHYVEPTFRFVALAVVIIIVLHIFNMFRDSKNQNQFVEKAFSLMINGAISAVVGTSKGLLWFAKTMLKITTVLFATVRDFFVSKI